MAHRAGWFSLLLAGVAGCCAPAGPLVALPPAPDQAAARSERAVVWYTSLERATAGRLAAEFRAAHSIEVRIVHGTDGELKDRVLREAAAPGADVVQIADPGLLAELRRRDLLRKADVPNGLRIARMMADPGGFWLASHGVTAVVLLRTDGARPAPEVKAWRDLADPAFRKKLVLPDPAGEGPALYWAAALERLYGRDFLGALGRNAAAVVPFHLAVERLKGAGEAVAGGASGEAVWRAARDGDPVRLIVPEEGVPVVPAAAALTRNAPHPNGGALLLDFLLSPAAQRVLASDGFYPALPGIEPPAGRVPLDRLRMLQLPWERTARRGAEYGNRLRGAAPGGSSEGKGPPRRTAALSRPAGNQVPAGAPVQVRGASAPPRSVHPCGWFPPAGASGRAGSASAPRFSDRTGG